MDVLSAQNVTDRAEGLKGFWSKRNNKFKDWMKVLDLEDELKQEGMESFVANDPRANYNVLLYLLSSQTIPHRYNRDRLVDEAIPEAEMDERIVDTGWADVNSRNRQSGRGSWLRTLYGHMLMTGWYSVFSWASDDGLVADIWHPAEVFPNFSENGMDEVARVFSMNGSELQRAAVSRGWLVPKLGFNKTQSYTISDYFVKDGTDIYHALTAGSDFLVPINRLKTSRMPVLCGPVGGMPERGEISGNKDWVAKIGQSFVQVNEQVMKSYNKQWTFSQQMLRDTAQTRWLEISKSQKILNPKDMYRRGAIFRGQLGDRVEPLPVPPIPVELRGDKIDMEGMIQRGWLPWTLFGNVSGNMSAYVVSQIAASAKQVLFPFHDAGQNVLTDIDNYWVDECRENSYQPYQLKVGKPQQPGVKLTAEYEIQIPGDAAARATVARMLAPNFQLSEATVARMQFPEIKDYRKEAAQVQADAAKKHPAFASLSLVQALKQEARTARAAKDNASANLYEGIAARIEQSLVAPPPQQTEPEPQSRNAPSSIEAIERQVGGMK